MYPVDVTNCYGPYLDTFKQGIVVLVIQTVEREKAMAVAVQELSSEQRSTLSAQLHEALDQLTKLDELKAHYEDFLKNVCKELGIDVETLRGAAMRFYRGEI